MEIDEWVQDGIVVVALRGDLDSRSAPEVQQYLQERVPASGCMVIDLQGTPYMSSAGLRVMLLAHRRARDVGAKLCLSGATSDVLDVMRATGFLEFFTIADSDHEAIAAVQP